MAADPVMPDPKRKRVDAAQPPRSPESMPTAAVQSTNSKVSLYIYVYILRTDLP